jgi:acyl-CoA hydrolase
MTPGMSREMIAIAHPDDRDELSHEARSAGILR